jgi:hypothetical protein
VTTQSDWQHTDTDTDTAEDDTVDTGAADFGHETDPTADPIAVSSSDPESARDSLAEDDDDDDDGDDVIVLSSADVVVDEDEDDGDEDEDADEGLSNEDPDDALADPDPIGLGELAAVPVTADPTSDVSAAPVSPAETVATPTADDATLAPAAAAPASGGMGALSPQWHDIQAQFVDDPSGSVQLAAAAVDDAVTELVATLHQRRAGLVPDASLADDPQSTEQLREALRSCRQFCQNLADISERFARPEATVR